MQEKLEKTISINFGCCYRVNTNTILLLLHCGKASLFAQGHKVNITEHKRANLQILFYAFTSICTNKTNTVQLLVLVHSKSSHAKFIKRYRQ